MNITEAITASHPFLQSMRPAHRVLLLKSAAPAEFNPNQIILREGDYADKFYLIHHGKVALECHTPDGDVLIEIIGDNEVLGWSWLFPPFTWHFQARALEPTVALQFNAPHVLIATEEDDAFGHDLMKRIAQLAIHRMQETRKRLIEANRKNPIELGSLI